MDLIKYGKILINEEFIDVNYHTRRIRVILYNDELWYLSQNNGEIDILENLS